MSMVPAEHQPAPRNFAVIAWCDDIGKGAQDKMEVICKDCKAKQVDAERGSELLKVWFD